MSVLCVAESETHKAVSEPVNTEVPSTHSVSLSLKQTKMSVLCVAESETHKAVSEPVNIEVLSTH